MMLRVVHTLVLVVVQSNELLKRESVCQESLSLKDTSLFFKGNVKDREKMREIGQESDSGEVFKASPHS